MSANIAIGIQDFSTLIENHYFYVDKTDFIKEWWDCGDSVTLITRPGRFGKTLTMSYDFILGKHKCKQSCREISS